ncbi:ATP-dependent exonuclease SbcCD, C subunit-like protein [Pyxidicoccus fallax]|uniref:ATP-dependent exonuclease SbcCD, C subunit-like protein n=1 Tax=Pyxidicoccus fallax TaxID=394095 RepID=A0A848LQY6_9BACT|nr:SbcC/MukB-like Walker B domain-containing protein [Pyxidicoccus fallax]NMO20315.1 ATP-dependent exonuclease SbcCD, C subunit-like protein [Pyxidicoccus fallax]NPC81071.1 ATP-dependent exonuclease SbcCD, C subunit-like protein [Pyxidicoccus fallax]
MSTATPFSQSDLMDYTAPDARAGFRLYRFEAYNWGTFHQRVWHLGLGGDNGLLTGDIGSGKSTMVDGVVTLLVPPQKLAYNKAAGAESRERTLRSYVLGQYKSERGEHGSRPVFLRDGTSYSVILGHFYNEAYDQHVTLAQVFWMRESEGQPARLYIVADGRLSISEHFAGFGSDISALKKRLKGVTREVHETFPPYAAAFRRRFGIKDEQALDLFLQTVSMKAVGNLTDFVRQHMLQPSAVESRLAALIGHFDDLHRAHEAVLKAKKQMAQLEPLVRDCEKHEALATELATLRRCREALRPWFAGQKARLLQAQLTGWSTEREQAKAEAAELVEERRRQGTERDRLKQAIAANGGQRLETVKTDLAQRRRQREARFQKAERYAQLATAVGLPAASDAEAFLANTRAIQGLLTEAEGEGARTQHALTDVGVELRALGQKHTEVEAELQSLRRRRSNLPSRMLALRERMCAELGLDADALPFVGELLQVREEERDWEGAIERVLHGFGTSLLVSDAYYAKVAQWVERTHLDGRLVYYRVKEEGAARVPALQPHSLLRKLAIKPDSGMYRWLEAELARRFDYACCDTLEQFRRERQALTRSGQLKRGGEQHEKDDRFRLDDRSRYVLGWTNDQKRAALESEARALEARLDEVTSRAQALEAKRKALQGRRELLSQLAVYDAFRELDWKPVAVDLQRLEEQLRELESASDVLHTLEGQLVKQERALERTEAKLKDAEKRIARLEVQEETARKALASHEQAQLDATEELRACYPRVESLVTEAAKGAALETDTLDERERQVREDIQRRIDAEGKRMERGREAIIRAMQTYRADFPLETQDVDASLDAAAEYAAMLKALRTDDLPRFETRFKSLLTENTIREVVNFQGQLLRERQDIRERIDTINRSLRAIDYNPGTYIVLEASPSTDADVRDFQAELRACTEGPLTGAEDDAYSEKKFLEVKRIIERFRGREGSAEADARWTRRVTDVRNWFSFSASERWREDDREHEHYTDSGGKSGGQKEKLAYTVLAASLAYQFGLEWGETRSRSFRFVVIDEAFGRGSDESAAYGLELFKRLNLQLLIVTPLQKIRVIEPYVASVGFVHNEEGRSSKVRNLTIDAYRAEREARGH